MGTLLWKCAYLALLIQVAVGLPSFGTGSQIEKWNEVDDEHPGEKIPADYMMPMRDPNGKINEKTTVESKSEAPKQSAAPKTETKKEDNIPKPVPESLTTVKPQVKTANVDDKVNIDEESNSLPKPQEKEHKPILIVRIRALPSHEELPAPTPTPRPPTAGEEEDCECVECKEAQEKQKLGGGNVEDLDCQDTEATTPEQDSGSGIEIIGNIKILEHSRGGKEDMADLKSNSVTQFNDKEMELPNEKGSPKIVAGIIMKVSGVKSDDDAPCDMEDTNSQERPSENNRENEPPIIKGLLLKSLMPRKTLSARDIYELMNGRNGVEKKGITSLSDVLKHTAQPPSRFVALQNESYKSRLPPLRFPEQNVVSISRGNGLPPIFREIPSDNGFVSPFLNRLTFPNVFPSGVTGASPFQSFNSLGQYNEHLRKFDPQMKELMDVVLRQMAGHAAFSKSLKDMQLSK